MPIGDQPVARGPIPGLAKKLLFGHSSGGKAPALKLVAENPSRLTATLGFSAEGCTRGLLGLELGKQGLSRTSSEGRKPQVTSYKSLKQTFSGWGLAEDIRFETPARL